MVRFAFQTMLDEGYSEPASFVEVSPLFMDDKVQTAVKQLLKDKELKRRWDFQDTLEQSRDYGDTVHWLTSKFDDIARDSTLRVVMGGNKKTVDIEQIVQQGGILLVRIPEAVIGKQAADFVGSLIMLQLRMAIIRRREFGKLQHYHFVYVDEFQNFANTDFHTLVAEARKFNIGFTLANQNLEQLREFRTYTGYHEQRLINAIFGNVGNIIVFGVGAFDANFLSGQFSVPARDIMRIGRWQALAKLVVNDYDTTPFTLWPEEAVRLESPRNIAVIEKRMREEKYWIEPSKVLEDISGRLDRVIKKAEELPEAEIDRPRIFRV
jgi:type IV secretory system conjugative DNA transfer VirD4/TraG family protein